MKKLVGIIILIAACLTWGWIINDLWEINRHRFIASSEASSYNSFDFFYTHFSTDSVYQAHHVKLPIEHTTWILEKMELYKQNTLTQWGFRPLPASLPTILFDNYEMKLTGSRRLLQIDNILYYFEFQDENWNLIKVEEFI